MEEFRRRKFHNSTLKQALRDINFIVLMLIFHVCVVMFSLVRILQINFHKLGQIAKKSDFSIVQNFHAML